MRDALVAAFYYEPETGLLYRKVAGMVRWDKPIRGSMTGGYLYVSFQGKRWAVHQLAWIYMKGKLPEPPLIIDHKDSRRSNNIWANLREATPSQNAQNQARSKNNTTTKNNFVTAAPVSPEVCIIALRNRR